MEAGESQGSGSGSETETEDEGGEMNEDELEQRRMRKCVAVMQVHYPYMVTVAAAASADATDNLEDEAEGEAPERVRWPYYFAQPDWLSMYRKVARRPTALVHADEVAAHSPPLLFTTPVPKLQQMFMDALMPQNRPLLAAWIRTFAVRFALVDRDRDRLLLRAWMQSAFEGIRAVLRDHPAAPALTDLLSMLPLVEQGMRDGGSNADEPMYRVRYGGMWSETTKWEFYKRMFMPGPNRVAVPLPAGLILFEGRGSAPTAASVLQDRVRRAPFSTSWHPNVAMLFANGGEMFAHKIMSDGVLGIDAQCSRDEDGDGGELPLNWTECEVIVQPLVSFHRVCDAMVLLDSRPTAHTLAPKRTNAPVWIHTIFTHAFLGDVCPCEAQEEASEAAAETAHRHSPDPKRQRLQGRLQLD